MVEVKATGAEYEREQWFGAGKRHTTRRVLFEVRIGDEVAHVFAERNTHPAPWRRDEFTGRGLWRVARVMRDGWAPLPDCRTLQHVREMLEYGARVRIEFVDGYGRSIEGEV